MRHVQIRILPQPVERQQLSCTYLAHHELNSVLVSMIIIRADLFNTNDNK